MSRRIVSLALLFLAFLMVQPVMAQDGGSPQNDGMAGSIRTLKGQATVVRQEKSMPAQVGMHIQSGDILRTQAESSLGILFRDDTSLSLGPSSETVVDDFIFDPAQGNLSMMLNVAKGTAAFLSGEIAKLKPEAMVVSTPLATIGIRGTRFVVKVEE